MNRCTELALVVAVTLGLAACGGTPSAPASVGGYQRSLPRANAEGEFAEALAQMQLGYNDQASQLLQSLTQRYPRFSGPWTNLGILHAQARQYDQAFADFENALRANARNVVAMNWLGYLNGERRDFEQARYWYERALSIRPDYAIARLNLAIVYDTGLRQPQQALAQYRRYRDETQGENLIVNAWIRELENTVQAATTITQGGAP